MNNTRFSTALHILTLLAYKSDERLNSDFIASSININPVLVRKEIQSLIAANLVTSKKGKLGGVQLTRPSEDIFLSEIYEAIKQTDVLGKVHQNLNELCPIGQQMNRNLNELHRQTDQIVTRHLETKSLSQFLTEFTL